MGSLNENWGPIVYSEVPGSSGQIPGELHNPCGGNGDLELSPGQLVKVPGLWEGWGANLSPWERWDLQSQRVMLLPTVVLLETEPRCHVALLDLWNKSLDPAANPATL